MDDGIYFEDLPLGMEATSPARTMTEADIMNFAGLSGDFNVIHTDAETAKEGPFGQRIAHGLLGLSLASGLVSRNPGAEQHKLVAFLGMTWDFKRPIFIGDTIHVVQTIKEKKDTRKQDLGVIIFEAKIVNQSGKVCQSGEWKVMYARRPEDSADAETIA